MSESISMKSRELYLLIVIDRGCRAVVEYRYSHR